MSNSTLESLLHPPEAVVKFIRRLISEYRDYDGPERRNETRSCVAVPVTIQFLDDEYQPLNTPRRDGHAQPVGWRHRDHLRRAHPLQLHPGPLDAQEWRNHELDRQRPPLHSERGSLPDRGPLCRQMGRYQPRLLIDGTQSHIEVSLRVKSASNEFSRLPLELLTPVNLTVRTTIRAHADPSMTGTQDVRPMTRRAHPILYGFVRRRLPHGNVLGHRRRRVPQRTTTGHP